MRINSIVKLLSIPKSLYVSIRLCGLKNAFNLPVLVRYNCKLISLSGSALGNGKLDIGFGSVGIFDNSYQRCVLQIMGKIVMNGYSHFGPASKIVVGEDAILTIGDNVANSAACSIISMKNISIGDHTIISWDTLIMDSDFHRVHDLNKDLISTPSKEIIIESNCWLGARSVILKGAYIHYNTIIAANTTVTRDYYDNSILIAGNPATIKKYNIKPIP